MAGRLSKLAGVLATGAAAASLAACASGTAPRPAIQPSAVAPTFVPSVAERGLLVVGGSYTQGLGARPQTEGYAYQLGRMLGWPTQVDGASGTGFLNPGRHHRGTFAYRIARLHPRVPPGIVLIQVGRNDFGALPLHLYTAARHTVVLTRSRFHGAQVAFLGPIPGVLPVSRAEDTVDRVLKLVARSEDVLYIDPLAEHWISPANLRGFSGLVRAHPNNAGYAYIAQRLVVDLRNWMAGKSV